MFSYIKGRVTEKDLTFAVLEVGGVGFKIYTSQYTLSEIALGDDATFYTYLYIKEGIMDLYGFSSKDELRMFELLISVSGVGAKGAIAVLSLGAPSRIAVAVVTNDIKLIKSAQGIGPKIAQRIALELKDKIKNEELTSGVEIEEFDYADNDTKSEAISALMVLGYTKGEAQRAIAKVDPSVTDLEDMIKAGLKSLM